VFRVAFSNIGIDCTWARCAAPDRRIAVHELMSRPTISADEAVRIGLVAVCSARGLAARALECASRSPRSRLGRTADQTGMWTALELPSLQTAVEYEDRQQIVTTFGNAVPEAITAFLEKRPASFAD